MKVSEIMRVMETIAPARLAEPWDRIGLQIGSAESDVDALLVGMTPTFPLLAQAIEQNARMIVCHHPLIFKPLAALTDSSPVEQVAAGFIRHGIAFFAAHTNYDVAPGGVNDALASLLGLTQVQPLSFTNSRYAKVAVFVPKEALEKVSDAICAAGAGHIGAYSRCTFRIPGTGTFLPLEGARPYIGEKDKLEEVAELRLESIVPEELVPGVVEAIRKSHPYEEPAFDVYQLANERREPGLGRWGILPEPMPAAEMLAGVARKLKLGCLQYVGDGARIVSRVAVVGGAGGDYLKDALARECDVFITGDVRHHVFLEAADRGIVLADAGHAQTEWPGVIALHKRLAELLPGLRVMLSTSEEGVIKCVCG
ncbi:MAG TPA: Nif3-like dinuclear metal center hexameric protein [Planctomycetota bacterium]|nr:Nif3-like dinuclear metal center hexameric protein [Planctomycetota bacterium]